ncbi:MAG: glycosyltransferase family 2 protein [Nocardioidaceae bacterium]
MDLTVIVPTFNEAPNVAELVGRVSGALAEAPGAYDAEILFVDDSTDDTPDVIARVAQTSSIPVRLLHRDEGIGGLGGAVVEGLYAATADRCVIMDGDLQHPPEKIPELVDRLGNGDVDLVVASRYAGGGTAHGLADRGRVLVSRGSTLVTKAMFPIKLHDVSDPMTGFFALDRRRIDLAGLKPRGFKILLEMLARKNLDVAEVPFDFADRFAGESKASLRQGIHFLTQLAALRFGKMSLFAIIGGLGAVANLAIMWLLIQLGLNYVAGAVVAAEATIVGNFLLQERFVFQDMTDQASGAWVRFAKSFAFNNAEALIRIPVLAMMVQSWHISSIVAAAITLALAFVVRFTFHSLVVYAPRKPESPTRELVEELGEQVVRPGEL